MGSAGVQTARPRSRIPKTPQKGSSSSLIGNTPEQPIDLTVSPISSTAKKRKAGNILVATPSKKSKGDKTDTPKEKRLRRFRPKAPQSFQEVYDRALSQRFYVLKRERGGTDECPEETVEMTGSTGNIYTVTVAQVPDCNCPHAMKGNQCKHILYIMKRVLNAPDNLVYQLALVPSELRLIFAKAPPILSPKEAEAESNNRKSIEGDCPICFCEFDPKEDIVWCRAACGQNIHKKCFQMWAATKGSSGNVTCPFCRSAWQGDGDASKVRKEQGTIDEGYVNVASQLGISRERDESSYRTFRGLPQYVWADRKRFGGGFNSYRMRDEWDDDY